MDHRAFLERWFAELWGKRNAKIIDECVAEDCEIVGLPDTGRGRRAFHDFFVGFGALFPQVRVMVEDCMSDGERFAMRCAGYVVDDKGARHSFSGGGMGRIRNGQFVQAWNQWDLLTVLESMGAIPSDVLPKLMADAKKRAR